MTIYARCENSKFRAAGAAVAGDAWLATLFPLLGSLWHVPLRVGTFFDRFEFAEVCTAWDTHLVEHDMCLHRGPRDPDGRPDGSGVPNNDNRCHDRKRQQNTHRLGPGEREGRINELPAHTRTPDISNRCGFLNLRVLRSANTLTLGISGAHVKQRRQTKYKTRRMRFEVPSSTLAVFIARHCF